MEDLIRKQMREKLLQQFSQDPYQTQDVKNAQDNANTQDLIAGIGSALATAANAQSMSRGGKAPDLSMYDQIRQRSQDAIKQAIQGQQSSVQRAGQQLDMMQSADKFAADEAQRQIVNKLAQDKFLQDQQQFDTSQKTRMQDRLDQRNFQQQELDARRQDRALQQQINAGILADKKAEQQQQLSVPGLGIANNLDDAKKIKEASMIKQKFDDAMSEMIALREKHGGGAILNREDVARGKQLSKDAMLAYKDLANLGVLSKTDYDTLNQLIPQDPLAYTLVPGQDPIMSNLKAFKEDQNKIFQNQVGLRLRPDQQKQQPPISQFPKTLRNDKGEVATVSNEQDLKEALAEGFK